MAKGYPSEWRNYIYVLDTKLELHDYDWSKYAFSGMEEAVNFYNAVITHSKTESEDIETITKEEALKRIAAQRQKDMPQ